MVAHKILLSAPVPLVFFGTLNWVGLVWGLKDLGLGLDNTQRFEKEESRHLVKSNEISVSQSMLNNFCSIKLK